MPLTTNTSPYFDDYSEEKQFYRILFRPGYPVQARELTQLQTALQKQIERHGRHVFAHGSRVLGGEFAYNKCKYIKLSDYVQDDSALALIDVNAVFSASTLRGAKLTLDTADAAGGGAGDYSVDGITVQHPDGRRPVAEVVFVAERNGAEDPTILLNYTSGDEFQANDHIKGVGSVSAPFQAVVNASASSTANATGSASYASIANGVYFVTTSTGGYFSYVPKQRIILEKYNNTPTWKVGLKITESIVDESADATLFDNAQGVYQNYAPGAHRLKIALDLAKDPSGDGTAINPVSSKDFVELVRIDNGVRAYGTPNQDPVYNILGNMVAERTFDESGNYVVNEFECYVEEAASPPNDQIKITLRPARGLATAKAYIQGRQYEQVEPLVKYIDKARKTGILRELTTSTKTGPVLTVKDLRSEKYNGGRSFAEISGLTFWDIHSCNTYQIDTTNQFKYDSTRIGRFRLRSIRNGEPNSNTHQIFLTDYQGSPSITGNFTDVPVAAELGSEPGTVKVVTIQGANTSNHPNAHVGALLKITSTGEYSQNTHVGQTRTVIASVYESATKTQLTLATPIIQPSSNSSFPGENETYSLSLGLMAAGTGNGCIVDAGVNPSALGTLQTSAIGANAELIAGVTHDANTNPILGGFGGTYNATLLSHIGTGGGLVANTLSSSVTGTELIMFAQYEEVKDYSSNKIMVKSEAFRDTTTGYTDEATFASLDKQDWVVINETTGFALNPLDFELSGTVVEITITSDLCTNGDSIRVIAPVKLTNFAPKSKTLRQGYNTQQAAAYPVANNRTASWAAGRGYANGHVVFPTPNQTPGGKDNLGMVDVYKIRDIYDTGAPNWTANGKTIGVAANRVTQNYTLDSGQREDMYDYASLVLKPGARPPKGQLLAVYDWFEHTESAGANFGFFSIDSYVGLEQIPSFVSDGGRRIHLKDYLDFRPTRAVTDQDAANTSYFVNVVSIPSETEAVPTAGKAIFTPDTVGAAFYDMQFFAPRIDKVVLSLQKDVSSEVGAGYINIVSGSDDQIPPTTPRTDKHDMALFTLGIPSYTFDAKHVNITKENNRRWTMKDITKINNKVKRLEYYSSLNLLEQDLQNLTIYDKDNNLERFKNGFLVDTFRLGTAVADVGTPGNPNLDFQASIGDSVLRPAVEQENVSLFYDPNYSQNIQNTGHVIHLPFTVNREVAGSGTVQNFSQLNATTDGAENLNPFQVQNFQGILKLSPSSDIWRSTVDTPEPIVQDTTGALSAMMTLVDTLNARMGGQMTVWNDWDENWFGNEPQDEGFPVNRPRDPNAAMALATPLVANQFNRNKGRARKVNINNSRRPAYAAGPRGSEVTTPSGEFSLFSTEWDQIDWKNSKQKKGKQFASLTRVYDDELETTQWTGTQTREGTHSEYNIVVGEPIEVGELIVNSSTAQFMRPIDIKFKARGIKPNTKFWPFFNDVNIKNYVERANELVLTGASIGSKIDAKLKILQQPILLSASDSGRGTAIGASGNTVWLVSANGSFGVDDVITSSISGAISTGVTVKSYKHYSGTVQGGVSATLILDDSASPSGGSVASQSWLSTAVDDRAYNKSWGSYDTDLYGRTIYITEGRGYGQSRTISGYTNSTFTATLSTPWTITPNTQSRYSIGDATSSKYGSAYGVFHVPNYNWANRIQKASLEGTTASDSQIWDMNNVESDDRTDDVTRFVTGSHVISLRDSETDTAFIEGGLQSQAKGSFQAAGVIETRQVYTQDTYGTALTTTEITEERPAVHTETFATGNRVEVGQICHRDPLAQSFLVDPESYPEGVMANSIDLWFKTKHDTSATGTDLPVICEIRPMIAGVPHGGIILGSAELNADDINISSGDPGDIPDPSGSSANMTTFEFDRPIHLMGGQEYAIVVRSESIEYEAWTAVVGSNKVGTGGKTGISAITVDSQPHTGSLFKSQNGSTWDPAQDQDLMFRLNICIFDTSTVGTVFWRTPNVASQYTPNFTRTSSPFSHPNYTVSATSPALVSGYSSATGHKVWENNFVYDRFRVDTSTADFGSSVSSFQYYSATENSALAPTVSAIPAAGWTNLQLKSDTIPSTRDSVTGEILRQSMLKDKTGSFVLKGTLSTRNKYVSPMINEERISLTMMKNLINDGNLYANTWPSDYVLLDDYTGGNTVGGGFAITPGEGYTDGAAITFRSTTIDDTETLRLGTGATGTLIANGTGSIVGVTLTNTGNTYLQAPIIGVSGGSGGAIEYVGEDNPRGPGNFLARYMTRRVVLAEGFDSKDLAVYLTASQQQGTKVHVYAKVRSKEDSELFEDKRWQLMTRGQSPVDEFTSSESEYKEIEFGGDANVEHPFAYTLNNESTELADTKFNTFNEFAIKIVMQSNNPVKVPVVKNLRAIAID